MMKENKDMKELLEAAVNMLPSAMPPHEKRRIIFEILSEFPQLSLPLYHFTPSYVNPKDEHALRNELGKINETLQKLQRGEIRMEQSNFNEMIEHRNFVNECIEVIVFGG